MERTSVISSNIRTVGYDPEASTLEVEFRSGGVYQYNGVEQALFDELMEAPSVGRFFHQRVRGIYQGCKLDPEEQ